MRPFRLLLSLFTCVIAVTLLLYARFPASAGSPQIKAQPHSITSQKKGKIRSLFSWTAPSSLFPPSAIISLTDDNSTFFLARPAAFGPTLPTKGLSGALWVGSGFGDDALSHGGLLASLEGELGCSDAPGWSEGNTKPSGRSQIGVDARRKGAKDAAVVSARKRRNKRSEDARSKDPALDSASRPEEDDGTDDYLHQPLGDSDLSSAPSSKKPTEHADIQSLQEGAEIAGKIVLLSRGGCGFLEKVLWVQRRGGTALIVGDNIRGGPLITMYARGDTSNVTIPALFTSHTTAHLLSSLMPSGGFMEGLLPGSTSMSGGKKADPSKNKESSNADTGDKAAPAKPKTSQITTSQPKGQSSNTKPKTSAEKSAQQSKNSQGFWSKLSSFLGLGFNDESSEGGDNQRPPSSGHIDWVLVEDFADEKPNQAVKTKAAPGSNKKPKPTTSHAADDFVIGVQDWRDPDLLPQQTGVVQSQLGNQKSKPDASNGSPKGGSIMPGSGEYSNEAVGVSSANKVLAHSDHGDDVSQDGDDRGWLSSLQWGHSKDDDRTASSKRHNDVTTHPNFERDEAGNHKNSYSPAGDSDRHEGLWVTLTPTSMSSSPFFDTLLVLVVSPLVTLTVVYALLLLRSRIRRRRWRAPKSIVERLPVRTYHTLPSDNSSTATTPVSPSPTTPLLSQHPVPRSPRPTSAHSRPRSRTTSEVPAQASSSFQRQFLRSPSPETEKRGAGLAEWRRRYGGRQKECVVCLEEYVDGISRVMSLPCGHEFHVECM